MFVEIHKHEGLVHTPCWDFKGFKQCLLGLFIDGAASRSQHDGVVLHLLVVNPFQAFCQLGVLGECYLLLKFWLGVASSLQYSVCLYQVYYGIGLPHSLSILDPDHVWALSCEPA